MLRRDPERLRAIKGTDDALVGKLAIRVFETMVARRFTPEPARRDRLVRMLDAVDVRAGIPVDRHHGRNRLACGRRAAVVEFASGGVNNGRHGRNRARVGIRPTGG